MILIIPRSLCRWQRLKAASRGASCGARRSSCASRCTHRQTKPFSGQHEYRYGICQSSKIPKALLQTTMHTFPGDTPSLSESRTPTLCQSLILHEGDDSGDFWLLPSRVSCVLLCPSLLLLLLLCCILLLLVDLS